MSQNRKLTSLVSVVALLGVTSSFTVACGEDGAGGGASCGEISARVEALQASSDALVDVAAGIKTEVVGACATLAGMSAPGSPSDNDVTTICNAAKARLDAALTGSVSVVIVPPKCTVDAQAQFMCEAGCQAEANLECEPPSLEVRCDPGELSVQCEGTCNVDAYCEGSAEVAVDCQGECQGRCDGMCTGTCKGTCEGTCMGATGEGGSCDGTCMGTCDGECSANCMGECRGSCKVTAMGGVSCGANARCKGGCTGTARAPQCEGTLTPAQCTGDANVDCSADCEGSASLNAECTEPSIDIVGNVEADVRADIVAALPTLIQVTGRGELALDAVTDLGTNFASVASEVGACTLQIGAAAAAFTGALAATAEASASVSVSFQASANVSASAG